MKHETLTVPPCHFHLDTWQRAGLRLVAVVYDPAGEMFHC